MEQSKSKMGKSLGKSLLGYTSDGSVDETP